MGSVRIVTRHEFRTAVTRPSYIILTAAVPVLVALAVAGFAVFTLVTREDAEAETASSAESSADRRQGWATLTSRTVRRCLAHTRNSRARCSSRCRIVTPE